MDNAIKYSQENRYIEIYGRSHRNNVEISIEDFGLGLPEKKEEIDRLFDRGTQNIVGRRFADEPGEGIGLWEAQLHVKAHGGVITANSYRPEKEFSKEGEGYKTVFTVILPINQAPIGRI